MNTTRRDPKGLKSDTRGAVLVEFLVAFMPLMITFSSFVQLAQIATARLVVKHSTVVGARAAAVISNKASNTPDQKPGDNQDEIDSAVKLAMGPWAQTMKSVTVSIDDKSSCSDQYGDVKVTVDADYRCSVPFGNRLVCGAGGGGHRIKQAFTFPHQGARYEEGGGGNCGQGALTP
jgi:Flp pilus assembly protein TadG